MCLTATAKETKNLRRRLKRNGFVWMYKIVRRIWDFDKEKYVLKTPYMNKEIKTGWFVSNRKEEKVDFASPPVETSPLNGDIYDFEYVKANKKRKIVDIDKGIHIFTNEKAAKIQAMSSSKIIKVKCYEKDFVAAGTFDLDGDSAVFMKVFVPKDEYDNALKS